MAKQEDQPDPFTPDIPETPPPPRIPELLTKPVQTRVPIVASKGLQGASGPATGRQATALGLASNFAFGVLGMSLLGWALQRWVWPGGAPWLVLGFACTGLVAGSYVFVREAIRMNQS